jgi:hypothetical protein
MTFLCDSLAIRKILQKAEFFMCWAIFFLTAVRSKNAYLAEQTSPSMVLSSSAAIFYIRLSLFTRSYAYAIDLANAWVKFDSNIPKWLVLHHSGVWSQHAIKAFFLTPHSPLQIMMFALGSQSSHNTWTKKHSLLLYWGNVIVGVLVCVYDVVKYHERNIFASRCFYYSLLVTSTGILLLALDTYISSKMKKMTGRDMTRTRRKVLYTTRHDDDQQKEGRIQLHSKMMESSFMIKSLYKKMLCFSSTHNTSSSML